MCKYSVWPAHLILYSGFNHICIINSCHCCLGFQICLSSWRRPLPYFCLDNPHLIQQCGVLCRGCSLHGVSHWNTSWLIGIGNISRLAFVFSVFSTIQVKSWPSILRRNTPRLYIHYNHCSFARMAHLVKCWPRARLQVLKISTCRMLILRVTSQSVRDCHSDWGNSSKKYHRECSKTKVLISVHWWAQCNSKWPRGCRDFQYPEEIKLMSTNSMWLILLNH